ncbi:hypothetical protein UNDKW_0784 [Undibacterium sp. KW1]|nr:hypothetical protein UNDKW_0784 [Undibacterium sp. KW1]
MHDCKCRETQGARAHVARDRQSWNVPLGKELAASGKFPCGLAGEIKNSIIQKRKINKGEADNSKNEQWTKLGEFF